jgi:hypothetical protein
MRIKDMKVTERDIGKRVTFKAATRWSFAKATRIIRKVHSNGNIEVRFGGWDAFIVRPHEIIEVHEER